jgi:hypothetical protein
MGDGQVLDVSGPAISRRLRGLHTLDADQVALVRGLIEALLDVPGLRAVALGGSYARGMARTDSDIDIGLYYAESTPLCVRTVREITAGFPGSERPVVAELFEWGPWVNGGAWLTIGGRRVDLIYRSLEHLERVIAAAERGDHERDFGQQPPFGFFGPTYLGELAIAVPLFDPAGRIAALKGRVATYPEALRRRVIQSYLGSAEFELHAFAPKFAHRGGTYLTAGTIARSVHSLIMTLFALNRRYFVNDKTALDEVSTFALCPVDFRERVEAMLASIGFTPDELEHAVAQAAGLCREVAGLASEIYVREHA